MLKIAFIHALKCVVFCISNLDINKKLERKLIEDFHEAVQESSEILGSEKAKKLIEEYKSEKDKRNLFTYELGQIAMQNKAKTSLERAKFFNQEIKKLIKL